MGSDAKFTVVRRGYDIDQVEAHVRSLRRETQQRLDESAKRIEALESELGDAKKREESVHLTLVAATQTKKEMLEVAQRELSESAEQAKETAEQILSEAQFEAFRLVTQASQEAEASMAEAKEESNRLAELAVSEATISSEDAERIRAEAQAEADHKIEEARTEALAMINEIRKESEKIVADRDAELARMRQEMTADEKGTNERAERLLNAVGDLEGRLQLAAKGVLEELLESEGFELKPKTASPAVAGPPITPEEPAVEDTPAAQEPAVAVAVAAPAVESTPASDPQPASKTAVPVAESATEVTVDDTDEEPLKRPERGSFYSRRSARLPRIGPEAANDALAAVSAMRSASRRSVVEDDEGNAVDKDDRAMQTA